MSNKPSAWHRLARELGCRSDEASQRASINRAYYASYHRCLAWEGRLPARGSCDPLSGVHAQLISRLRHPDQACSAVESERSVAISKLLRQQRELRAIADYELNAPISKALVDKQLKAAHQLMTDCEEVTSPSLTPQRLTR